ncbi:MAG: putative endoribonuclease [Frankiales bacterium]|jgi:enamine deaminase RidA (YjgF/YER057c/UK114 family)|nr:putative endoribonuclease [Frankiales bacterium]
MSVEARVEELGLQLVSPFTPPAARVNNRIVQRAAGSDMLYISGRGPGRADGEGFTHLGCLGDGLTVQEGYDAAAAVALEHMGILRGELGTLDHVRRWIKVTGFVRATSDFTRHPEVLNGFSDLIVSVFGEEVGRHARSAIGVASLPFGIPVEVEAIVQVATVPF